MNSLTKFIDIYIEFNGIKCYNHIYLLHWRILWMRIYLKLENTIQSSMIY